MLRTRPFILVVDDDRDASRAAVEFLRAHDLEVLAAEDERAAREALDARPVHGLVMRWDGAIDGASVIRHARTRHPEVCVIAIVASTDAARAADAWREGAVDVQAKPLVLGQLHAALRRGVSHQSVVARLAEVEAQLDERLALGPLAGASAAIRRVTQQIPAIAATRSTVLIEGEPGTGKGHAALAMHRQSARRALPFVAVDCGALAAEQIEATLFGRERGGLSEADPDARGRFEIADGGTLFLDDVGDVPPGVQIKLLRVLQDRSLERGGTDTVKVDVRLIAATRHDLGALVESGRFRDDLFRRLSAVRIRMPQLRERREDLPALVDAIVHELNRVHGRKATGVTRGVLERMMAYSWPGNVRELESTIERMIVPLQERRPIDVTDLPEALRKTESESRALEVTVGMTVEEAERKLIEATLEHTAGDKPRAAAMLGIGLRTLYRKLQQYGLR